MVQEEQLHTASLLVLILLPKLMKKHYIEIDDESGKILCFSASLSSKPSPVFAKSTVYDIDKIPENFTHYIEGMVFDPNTKTLSHSKESLDFYQEVLEKLNYQVNCCP